MKKNKSTVFLVLHAHETDAIAENMKIIGVYSTKSGAEKAVQRLSVAPGFCESKDGFHIDEYPLNTDHWSEGFVV